MTRLVPFLFLILVTVGTRAQEPSRKAPRSYQFVHGNWFDGKKFVEGNFYTVNGMLTALPPARVDSVIDLAHKNIVPPYAEAHNHNIDGFKKVEQRISKYLSDGVFYVKNPNSIPRTTSGLTGKVNIPTSLDVIFSNGGLTATGGHPLELVRRNIGLGIFTGKDAEGGMYYIIDTERDLDQKWQTIISARPDFIKTYLLYSEEYLKRKDDSAYFGWKGLDPALLPKIVQRAHRDSLRVSTHIETAADFHNALAAGVDEINHMPGFRADSTVDFSRYEIADEDAREAAANGVTVVTTLASSGRTGSPAYQEKFRILQMKNLDLLKRYGVRIAVGSDEYRQNSVEEAFFLHQLNVFDNAELLRVWCENTAEAIFPRRKIGHLREGYEASFLVLGGDPIQDFANTRKILLRVKQGEILPGGD